MFVPENWKFHVLFPENLKLQANFPENENCASFVAILMFSAYFQPSQGFKADTTAWQSLG